MAATKTRAKMGRPPLPEGQRKGDAVSIRLDPETARRLESLAERLGLGRSTAARECMLAGLAALERKGGAKR